MTSEYDTGVATQSIGGSTYTDTASDTAADTSPRGTAETVKTTASTAADQGRRVAGTAKAEAQSVAETAVQQTRSVMTDAAQQASEQATVQRDKLSQTLRTLGDDLARMASQDQASGLAADLAREAASRAHAFGSHLEGREPAQLLDDVREMARRRPGTFLLGALAAGVVAGRLFRASADGMAAAQLAGTSGRHTEGIDTSATSTGAPRITPVLPADPIAGDAGELIGRPSMGTP